MPNIIHLLPDSLANQIAAGEVVQRPSSAVKELLENAVDAGATEIYLKIEDAGKALIHVRDNGSGMSETDARMAFERHATSKIASIADLFNIQTMGFRGEALASIAAVAQVALKTKKADSDLGTFIAIENSKVQQQAPCAHHDGTTISVKNLFFNVPARRNFLKSNATETRHIVDEFVRVAMSFPTIFFSFTNNADEVWHLEKGSLKQRVVKLLGNNYETNLVAVAEQTDYMNITGFVGKPSTAKKTRGDQYFFVNQRFIKSAYLNHAVGSAFAKMIPGDSFPSYVLFISLNTAHIDINVHPTKQEIKFDDERVVYAFVQAAVKHALAQFSIAPSLDFTLNTAIQNLDAIRQPFTEEQKKEVTNAALFQSFSQKNQAHFIDSSRKGAGSNMKNWTDFFTPASVPPPQPNSLYPTQKESIEPYHHATNLATIDITTAVQLHKQFIIVEAAVGFLLIHQQLAHERILYEHYSVALTGKPLPIQKLLFPVVLTFSPSDAVLIQELLCDLKNIGYEITATDNQQFSLQGVPPNVRNNEKTSIENLLEHWKHFNVPTQYTQQEKLIRCAAKLHSIKCGQTLAYTEMHEMLQQLIHCKTPNLTPTGQPTFLVFSNQYVQTLFGN